MSAPPPWESSDRVRFRLTFDEDAAAYDRTRPVAPGHVFDELVELGGLRAGASVVEIGCGTGQATVPLAARGLRVVALEPGRQLAARARANLAAFPAVEVVTATFETWQPGADRFDAVVACNSFHWVDPAVRFEKSARVLAPGGQLIVLATPWVVPEDADRFWWDVQDDYAAVGAGRVDPTTKHPDRIVDIGPAARESGHFEEPVVRRHRFDLTFTADDYAVAVSTQAWIKDLPPAARAELIERIRQRIVAGGGTVRTHLLAVLTVARRR